VAVARRKKIHKSGGLGLKPLPGIQTEREDKVNTKQTDFTKGNIVLQMIAFSIPILLGEMFQNLYNSVDSLVVGNFVGKNALAAVSVCATLVNLIVGFFNGMSIGSSVVVSRAFGGRNEEKLNRSMRVAFSFSVVLGVVLSVCGIFLTPFLVRLSDAPAEVYPDAVSYLRIYLAGIMFTVIYNISAGILRAVGDSRTPFKILVFTSCINIVLDLVFVVVIPLGVAGVGVATIFAQFVSVAMAYKKLKTMNPQFCLNVREAFKNRDIIMEVTGIGMPSGLQGALISFSNLFVWRYVNGFGATAAAGIGIAQRLDKFIVLPCKAFGLTVTTFVSQNMGAGNKERAKKGGWRCLLLSIVVTNSIGFVVYCFADMSVALFNSDPEVIAYGSAMMHYIIPLYTLMAVREIYLGILRGYGNTKVPMVLSLIGMVVVRQIYLAISMRVAPSIENIYFCYPMAWGVTAALVFIYYQIVKKDF